MFHPESERVFVRLTFKILAGYNGGFNPYLVHLFLEAQAEIDMVGRLADGQPLPFRRGGAVER